MRMAIGLAGILVTIGVIVWIMSAITLPATKQALDTKKRVQPQVEQMAGHTADGTRAVDTVQVKAQERGGRLSAIVVTDIVEGAAMDKHFGLHKGDEITEIGPLSVKDMGSAAEAKDHLTAEYQRSGTITVLRDGKETKLPLPAAARNAAAAQAPAAAPAATPANGTAAPAAGQSSGDPLQKQLEAIEAPR
jgi:hypothetical protein